MDMEGRYVLIPYRSCSVPMNGQVYGHRLGCPCMTTVINSTSLITVTNIFYTEIGIRFGVYAE